MAWWINRNFLFIWSGQFVSRVGDAFYSIALAWWVLRMTHSSAMLGIMLAAAALPEMIVGPIAGVFVDRWNRKAVIVASDMLRGTVFLSMALLSSLKLLTVWEVFVATITVSMLSAFFSSASMALIPKIVMTEDIPRANSLKKITSGIATIIGPLLGAISVNLLGFSTVFGANGLTFWISSMLTMFLTLRHENNVQKRVFTSLQESFKFIAQNQVVLRVLVIIAIVHVFFGGLEVALPIISSHAGSGGLQYLAYLQMSLGVGMVGSALILNHAKPKHIKSRLLFLIVSMLGVCFIAFGFVGRWGTHMRYAELVIIFMIGAVVTIASVLWQSILHLSTPSHLTGRIFSITSTLADTSLPLSMLIYGMLMRSILPEMLLMVSGAAMAILGGVLLGSQTRRTDLSSQTMYAHEHHPH
jgi:DHA3 family macrolide efflux protein-like MFS transporter